MSINVTENIDYEAKVQARGWHTQQESGKTF